MLMLSKMTMHVWHTSKIFFQLSQLGPVQATFLRSVIQCMNRLELDVLFLFLLCGEAAQISNTMETVN